MREVTQLLPVLMTPWIASLSSFPMALATGTDTEVQSARHRRYRRDSVVDRTDIAVLPLLYRIVHHMINERAEDGMPVLFD